jgi:GTP-binding protein
VTLADEPGRSPIADYHVIREELRAFSADLAERPEIVAMTKADLPDVLEAYPGAQRDFAALGIELELVSAVTHRGLDELMQKLWRRLSKEH